MNQCRDCEYWAKSEFPESPFKKCYRQHDGAFFQIESDDPDDSHLLTLPTFGCIQFAPRVE